MNVNEESQQRMKQKFPPTLSNWNVLRWNVLEKKRFIMKRDVVLVSLERWHEWMTKTTTTTFFFSSSNKRKCFFLTLLTRLHSLYTHTCHTHTLFDHSFWSTLSFSLTNTHPFTSLSHFTHTPPHMHTRAFSLSYTLSHTLSHTHSHTHTLNSHTRTLLSLSS